MSLSDKIHNKHGRLPFVITEELKKVIQELQEKLKVYPALNNTSLGMSIRKDLEMAFGKELTQIDTKENKEVKNAS